MNISHQSQLSASYPDLPHLVQETAPSCLSKKVQAYNPDSVITASPPQRNPPVCPLHLLWPIFSPPQKRALPWRDEGLQGGGLRSYHFRK